MAWSAPRTWVFDEVPDEVDFNTHIRDNFLTVTPAGAILGFGGATAPSGWLACDGSAVSRTTYAALYAAIGTNYGTGDGSTTFNLPDFRGRMIAGKGSNASVDAFTDNEGATEPNRTPSHHHTYMPSPNGQISSAGGAQSTAQQSGSSTDTSGGGVQDKPAYGVALYIIKI